MVGWFVLPSTSTIQLRTSKASTGTGGGTNTDLCIGAATPTQHAPHVNISMVPCSSAAALVYDGSTGQIKPSTSSESRASSPQCLTAVQKPEVYGAGPPQLVLSGCNGIPDEGAVLAQSTPIILMRVHLLTNHSFSIHSHYRWPSVQWQLTQTLTRRSRFHLLTNGSFTHIPTILQGNSSSSTLRQGGCGRKAAIALQSLMVGC